MVVKNEMKKMKRNIINCKIFNCKRFLDGLKREAITVEDVAATF
jgi:hypothetical protein